MRPQNAVTKVQDSEKSLVALYKHQPKLEDADGERKAKFSKVRATISKPTKPFVKPPFYEPHWTDSKLISKSINEGKIVEGRLFFDKTMGDKTYGFVKVDPIARTSENPDEYIEPFCMKHIKIWGIRNLNRCYHLDKVYIKFVNWIDWGNAGTKIIKDIDFDELEKVTSHGQREMLAEYQHKFREAEESGTLDSFKFNDNAFKLAEVTSELNWQGEIDWDLPRVEQKEQPPNDTHNDGYDANEQIDSTAKSKKKSNKKKKKKPKHQQADGSDRESGADSEESDEAESQDDKESEEKDEDDEYYYDDEADGEENKEKEEQYGDDYYDYDYDEAEGDDADGSDKEQRPDEDPDE